MKLSIPESRQSRRWVQYLDEHIQSHIILENGAYVIFIDAIDTTLPNLQAKVNRVIQEATVKFGAETL